MPWNSVNCLGEIVLDAPLGMDAPAVVVWVGRKLRQMVPPAIRSTRLIRLVSVRGRRLTYSVGRATIRYDD